MLNRDTRESDDIQCQPANQQTSGDQTIKSTKHGNLDMSITHICPKSQSTSTRQISEKLLQDAIRNELADKKKSKKGFFTNVCRAVLACFGIKSDRKWNDPFVKINLFCVLIIYELEVNLYYFLQISLFCFLSCYMKTAIWTGWCSTNRFVDTEK
jgi:hypothetical protein